MAALIGSQIEATTKIYKFNNQDLDFGIEQISEGVSPELKVTGVNNTMYMHYPYGGVQLAHHLTYLKDDGGEAVEEYVNLTQDLKVTNAISIIKTSNIIYRTPVKLEVDFGLITENQNLAFGGLFDFCTCLFNSTASYKVCDSFITVINTQYPRFDDKIGFMLTYKGNTRDIKNWFKSNQTFTENGDSTQKPILSYLPYQTNEVGNIPAYTTLKLYATGIVNNETVRVGYIRPSFWLTKGNHLRLTYLLIQTHETFDYKNGTYVWNPLKLIADATGKDAMTNYGNPVFAAAILPAQ